LFGKASAKLLDTRLNLALLFTVSVLPDFDLLFFMFLKHRGPTHSLLFITVLCLPFLLVYKKKALPYFVGMLSHSLIGDIFSGGIQLFWPLSNNWVYVSNLGGRDTISVAMELSLFVVSTAVMLLNKDFQKYFFQTKTKRFYWLIPLGSVVGPLVLNNGHYGYLPTLLAIPSLFYMALFFWAMFGLKLKKENLQ
jgi:membrane-bound metal-dependent hydrolase YbcI (DUF457 family)